jgi:phospholipase C
VNLTLSRDAWAGSFEKYIVERSSPRTDCPTVLPSPGNIKPKEKVLLEHKQPLNDLQMGFMVFVSALNGGTDDLWKELVTEEEGVCTCVKI